MTEEEIYLAEFEKFKKELISAINSMSVKDTLIFIIDSGEERHCENCGESHKGLRLLAKANPEDFIRAAKLLTHKGLEQIMGVDENNWGKPKQN